MNLTLCFLLLIIVQIFDYMELAEHVTGKVGRYVVELNIFLGQFLAIVGYIITIGIL